jgi:hypothetical protein
MIPLLVATMATYYVWRYFTKLVRVDKQTQTDVPWLFFSELITTDDLMKLDSDSGSDIFELEM